MQCILGIFANDYFYQGTTYVCMSFTVAKNIPITYTHVAICLLLHNFWSVLCRVVHFIAPIISDMTTFNLINENLQE